MRLVFYQKMTWSFQNKVKVFFMAAWGVHGIASKDSRKEDASAVYHFYGRLD